MSKVSLKKKKKHICRQVHEPTYEPSHKTGGKWRTSQFLLGNLLIPCVSPLQTGHYLHLTTHHPHCYSHWIPTDKLSLFSMPSLWHSECRAQMKHTQSTTRRGKQETQGLGNQWVFCQDPDQRLRSCNSRVLQSAWQKATNLILVTVQYENTKSNPE